MSDKRYDDYFMVSCEEPAFFAEVAEMEENSRWLENIDSKSLVLSSIGEPMWATNYANQHGLDEDLAWETSQQTQLALRYVDADGNECNSLVRDTAFAGLIFNVIGLAGNNVSKISSANLAKCANIFLNDGLVKGKPILLLERYGKISAAHSDAGGGHACMPISRLMEVTKEKLEANFTTADFVQGTNSHGYTSASWTLPDAQSDILDIYRDALNGSRQNFAVNFMPGIKLTSSDTSNSCACLTPVFYANGFEFRFIDGVSVRHSKRCGRRRKFGIELFEEEATNSYSLFVNVGEVIRKLASITVQNGENCVVSLCNRYSIPKKYGDAAREMVCNFCAGGRSISAHDVYLCMTTIPHAAESMGAPMRTVLSLGELVGKIPSADWAAHDVGGTVSWGSY